MFKSIMMKFHTFVGIKKDISSIKKLCHLLKRKHLIKNYFKNNKLYKLHIGSNVSLVEGWLCSDIKPQNKRSIYLDATEKFPFNDNTFDYIYSEHMIEHISREDGAFMLRECYRILKPNGRIRIATPDIEKIIQLYTRQSEGYGNDYAQWITENFIPNSSEINPLVVVNTMFRNWYHQFLYDTNLLQDTLKKSGFSNIEKFSITNSNDDNLKGIEKHQLNVGNFEMVEFETLILEGKK